MKLYTFKIKGSAADKQTWEVEGQAEFLNPGEVSELWSIALKHAFAQLTQGKAVYGKPGEGCRGPYVITHATFELVTA
jgi:hypothetical protein